MSASAEKNWLLSDLLSDCAVGEVPAQPINGLNLDSRLVSKGDLYLAMDGAVTHGMRFAEAAVEAGAVAVATSTDAIQTFESTVSALNEKNIPVVAVSNMGAQLAQIASRFYEVPDQSMTLVAVTGTDGKTSVCRYIAQAFEGANQTCGYIGTLGWGIGEQLQSTELTTPDVVSLRRMLASLRDQGASVVALEASSHGLAEGRLDGLSIDVAVLTNFGRDHLDYHKTVEDYRAAKASLFSWPGLRCLVVNAGDSLGQELLANVASAKPIAFQVANSVLGANSIASDVVVADEISASDTGLEFTLIEGTTRSTVSTTLIGRFNVENLMACYGSLRACGVAANEARHCLELVKPVQGRMERFGGQGVPTVVVDYSHTPQALELAIESARVHCTGDLWVVFGCGGDRDAGKRAPMASASENADRVVLTDDNPRTEASLDIINAAMKGFRRPDDVVVISDRAEAIRFAISSASANDLVLVAGKGHEDYQIIGTTRFPFSDREEVLAALERAS